MNGRAIKCVAIDDEPLALEQLARFLERLPGIELSGKFYSISKAREMLQSTDVDVLFLDIDMPDCNGVEFARSLGPKCPHIIFVTAYSQYAVDGFRLDAVDYLLKPLSESELHEALEKVRRRMDRPADAHIFVKASGSMMKIPTADILYINGLGEYVQIRLRDRTAPVITFMAMKALEQELPADSFMRVHKSYIVNLEAITSASRLSLMIGDKAIPVGKKYRQAFAKYLTRSFTPDKSHP